MFLRRLAAFIRNRCGNVGIIFGLTAVPVVGAIGAGVDFARFNRENVMIQNVLDSAVLAGVRAEGNEETAAKNFFDAQLARLDLQDIESTFILDADNVLTGTASGTLETVLLGVMHIDTLTVSATSAARAAGGAVEEETPALTISGRICILLVDASMNQSLLANSGANVTAPGCEIHVRSTANPAAIVNGGSNLNVQKICVKGSKVIINGGAKPPMETNCAAIDDPYAGTLPVVSVPNNCTYSGTNYNANGADVTLPQGNHCNVNINSARNVYMKPGMYSQLNFNGSPKIWMEPGLYVFKNTTTINSGAVVTGSGVTIYFADQNSKIQFNGDVTLNLAAPGEGTYAGILFYEPGGLSKSQLVFNGTQNSVIEGMMYLPSRNVTFNSKSNITAHKVMMVYNSLILNGTGWTFGGSERSIPIYVPAPTPPPATNPPRDPVLVN